MLALFLFSVWAADAVDVQEYQIIEDLGSFDGYEDAGIASPFGFARHDRQIFVLDRQFQLWFFAMENEGLRPVRVTQNKGQAPGEISNPIYSFWADEGLHVLHANRSEVLTFEGAVKESKQFENEIIAFVIDQFVKTDPLYIDATQRIYARCEQSRDIHKNSAAIAWRGEGIKQDFELAVDDLVGHLRMSKYGDYLLVYNRTTVKDTIYFALMDLTRKEIVAIDSFPLFGRHDPDEVKESLKHLPPNFPKPPPFVPISGVTYSPELGFVVSEKTINTSRNFLVVHCIDPKTAARRVLKIARGDHNTLIFFIHLKGDIWAALDYGEETFWNLRIQPSH